MSERFSAALVKNLKITSTESSELQVIMNYINKILKHNISFLPERNYSAELSSSEFLLALSTLHNVVEKIKKYAPVDYVLPENLLWSQLVMNLKIPDDQAQQSQHLSDITELQAINFFTNKIERIHNLIGKENFSFKFNSACDIFNSSSEASKLDIIYDLCKHGKCSEVAIECKYLSYAFFTELIAKNLFNHENSDLQLLNQEVSNSLKTMFSQCDPFTQYTNTKITLGNKLLESLSIIEKNHLSFLPYVAPSLNQIISFNVNKKNKQMKLFKEDSKNILFISLCDLIAKHNIFQGVLHHYFSLNEVPPIHISVTEQNYHHIKWLVVAYKHEHYTYMYYELSGLKKDDWGEYYEYTPAPNKLFDAYLISDIPGITHQNCHNAPNNNFED